MVGTPLLHGEESDGWWSVVGMRFSKADEVVSISLSQFLFQERNIGPTKTLSSCRVQALFGVCVCVCLSVWLFVCLCRSVGLSVCRSVCLPGWLAVCLSFCLFACAFFSPEIPLSTSPRIIAVASCSASHLESLKCKMPQRINFSIAQIKDSTQTLFQERSPWTTQILNSRFGWSSVVSRLFVAIF